MIQVRSLKHYNIANFHELLSEVDWSQIYNCQNVTIAWTLFKDLFTSVLDKVAPIREVRIKAKSEPWMCSDITDLIRQRDKWLYKFKKHKLEDYHKNYCELRNKVHREISKAKRDYMLNKIQENRNNPKKLWSYLKTLGYAQNTKDGNNIVLNFDGEIQFDKVKVADYVNDFFTDIASNLVNKLPVVNKMYMYSVD